MSQFLSEVSAAFADLLSQKKLQLYSVASNPEAFGNALVELAGQGFHVRLLKDRGEVFADVAIADRSDDWVPLQRALRALHLPCMRADGPLSVADTAELVREHLADLEAGIAPHNLSIVRKRIEALSAEDARETLRRLRTERP